MPAHGLLWPAQRQGGAPWDGCTRQLFRDGLPISQCTPRCMQVLDECHHAQKDHPQALVLQRYHKWLQLPGSAPLQIIGFTASPASKPTEVHTHQGGHLLGFFATAAAAAAAAAWSSAGAAQSSHA